MSPSFLITTLNPITFLVIGLLLLKRALKDPSKSTISLSCAFLTCFVGLSIIPISAYLSSRAEDPSIFNFIIKFADVFVSISLFSYFVFLSSLVKHFERYTKLVFFHLLFTICMLLLNEYQIVFEGTNFYVFQGFSGSLTVFIFCLIYQGLAFFEFLKFSVLMSERISRIQARFLCAGALFAILAFFFILMQTFFRERIELLYLLTMLCAQLSGVSYYLGFELISIKIWFEKIKSKFSK
jgi:hypothetical protein